MRFGCWLGLDDMTESPHNVPPTPDALTHREREVADLVATGITNREIAARLTLSEKTIERHLSRIFAKLDIPSRAALAAAVERARSRPN
jgi:DNA-binding NarL/FixJ family response regulator